MNIHLGVCFLTQPIKIFEPDINARFEKAIKTDGTIKSMIKGDRAKGLICFSIKAKSKTPLYIYYKPVFTF